MQLDDIIAGQRVQARGDGSLGGAPGVQMAVVQQLDGEFLRLCLIQTAEIASCVCWIPLAWVDRNNDRKLLLNRTLEELLAGAIWRRPESPGGRMPGCP